MMEEKEQEDGAELSKSTSLVNRDYDEIILKTYFRNKDTEDSEVSELMTLRKEILRSGENTHFFLSRLHELAFYFSDSAKKENSNYDEELKITPLHVIKIKKARELRKAYLSIFNSTTRADVALSLEIDFEKVEKNITETFLMVTRGKLK